jgi:hypothetical protein
VKSTTTRGERFGNDMIKISSSLSLFVILSLLDSFLGGYCCCGEDELLGLTNQYKRLLLCGGDVDIRFHLGLFILEKLTVIGMVTDDVVVAIISSLMSGKRRLKLNEEERRWWRLFLSHKSILFFSTYNIFSLFLSLFFLLNLFYPPMVARFL